MKTPALPCRCSISSAGDQTTSASLVSTSKCSRRRSTMSGKTARQTRTAGLLTGNSSTQPDEGDHDEQRDQDGARPQHVAEEARHLDAAALGDGLDHEVR